MIGLALALLLSFLVDRVWPTGILIMLGLAAISTALAAYTRSANLAVLGEQADLGFGTLAIGFLISFGLYAAILLAVRGIIWLLRGRTPSEPQ